MTSRGAMSEKRMELVARRFRMLGEPIRLRILEQLEEGERTVGEMVEALGAGQPNISKHLNMLHDAGLVERRREGNSTVYGIGDPMIFKLCELVCRSEAKRSRAEFEALGGSAKGKVGR